jgi:hypothetical protein
MPMGRRLQQMGAVDHVYVYTDDKTPTGFKDDDKDEDMRRPTLVQQVGGTYFRFGWVSDEKSLGVSTFLWTMER